MAEQTLEYTLTCPHCGKGFTGAVLADDAGRPGGFKCPHCRLFVPFERAEELELLERQE